MGSVAVGYLAVAAVCYFDWLLADAATILKITSIFFCGLPCDSASIVDYTAIIAGELMTEKTDMEEAVVTGLNMVTNFNVSPYIFQFNN